jgi:hypothetical protein
MKTLYELLGALPDDNAEGLRSAFRKAVKETHPDINAGDPEAPLRFRRIVRANAILSDAEQRATYDRLLALALRQAGRKPERGAGMTRKLVSDMMMVGFLSVVSIGGYILFDRLSNVAIAPARSVEIMARGPVDIAAVAPAELLDASGHDEPRDKPLSAVTASEAIVPSAVVAAAHADIAQAAAVASQPAASPAPEVAAHDPKPVALDEPRDQPGSAVSASEASEAIAPNVVAPSVAAPAAKPDIAPEITPAGPPLAPPPNDAKSYRERGMFAYRDGDLNRAIADFDRAIQRDPDFADAYIDRGIAFYRLHEFDRAFADINRAKRIENANRAKTSPPTLRKDEQSSRSGRSRDVRS